MIRSPDCNLPPFPDPAPIAVGFPTPEDILLTKTDFAALLAYVDGLRSWIEAASGCIRGQQSFNGSVGSFLQGAR